MGMNEASRYLPLFVGNYCWWWDGRYGYSPRYEPLNFQLLASASDGQSIQIKLHLKKLSAQNIGDAARIIALNIGQNVVDVFSVGDSRLSYRTQSSPESRKSKIKYNLFPVVPVTIDAHIFCAQNGFDALSLVSDELAFNNVTDFKTWFHMEHKKNTHEILH